MSVLFDWYESPGSSGNSPEEKQLYPRVCLRPRCSTDELCMDIESMTTAHRADIRLVLSALSSVVGRRLRDGCQVHLDGLGYFNLTLTTTEPVYASTKNKKGKVRISGVKFRPDMEMKRSIGKVSVERLEETLHSAQLTDEEIDRRLGEYFAANAFITRSGFQHLCGMTQSTAMRHIRRLRDEGKIENRGSARQPIYVPAEAPSNS